MTNTFRISHTLPAYFASLSASEITAKYILSVNSSFIKGSEKKQKKSPKTKK